jgi:hypothetical protein
MKRGSNGELGSISSVTDVRWEMILTGGSHLSAGEREKESTLSGIWLGGPWAASEAGPNGIPVSNSIFFFLFFFSFSVFLCPSYYLQKCFKSIQTTFRNFLKINAMI